MSDQIKAERLADALGRYYTHLTMVPDINREAAAELRRLSTVNQELLDALKNYVDGCSVGVNANEVARAAIARATRKD
ncbi:MAG: hypothetical protein ING23_12500 [Roseomonas sp.]|nr:hypothetical protein [Roseomonas sp.]